MSDERARLTGHMVGMAVFMATCWFCLYALTPTTAHPLPRAIPAETKPLKKHEVAHVDLSPDGKGWLWLVEVDGTAYLVNENGGSPVRHEPCQPTPAGGNEKEPSRAERESEGSST